jgi:hypothetical protein
MRGECGDTINTTTSSVFSAAAGAAAATEAAPTTATGTNRGVAIGWDQHKTQQPDEVQPDQNGRRDARREGNAIVAACTDAT